MPKTRKQQREEFTKAYLEGRARRPHSHSRTIRRSLEERGSSSTQDLCPECDPVLSRHVSEFKSMVHQGSELIRRKRIQPYPKKSDATHYRDIVGQNNWLKSNVFDSLGNYLYCSACIRKAFGVSSARLSRLRNVKRRECSNPTSTMTKSEVEENRLGQYVVMPANIDCSFKAWWRSIEPSHSVQVRIPHDRHGNAGKVSHSAKTGIREKFLEFVDANSQPNGRSADSSGPTFYFSPKFTTIQMPKKGACFSLSRKSKQISCW